MNTVVTDKPKIFVASPLFNPAQIEIIEQIEGLLLASGFGCYSARLHSGSDKMTPEQRKDINAWDPVFDSNEKGLNDCRVMIAVLEYALPEKTRMCVVQEILIEGAEGERKTQVELPDAGTVYECGYFRAQGKLVIGFHTDKAKHLNLMLTHGCDGMIRGFDNLEKFLLEPQDWVDFPARLESRIRRIGTGRDAKHSLQLSQDAERFNWSVVEPWDAKNKDVE